MDLNINFEKISPKDILYWPIWMKITGIAIISIIVLILGSYFYIYPSIEDGKKLGDDIEKLKKEYVKKIEEVQKLEKYQRILSERQDYEVLEKLIPNEPDIVQFVKRLTEIGVKRQIAIQLIDPLEITDSPFKEFKVIPIKVDAEAEYVNLVNFLTDVINMGRLVSFEDLTIISNPAQESSEKERLSFSLLISTYFKTQVEEKKAGK